ncbi:ABC-three component system protein [Xanthocytophaga flava]|uniref:ABC-three component system protein n=1 Tax=Xanthocytophaga flava TaxID=3048013 RepID=UPI0028D1FC6E|nr:ABC-three component system protein [Xanthocytophaga flavus]MDJ1473548.1 hypothetical protein [Xanthocytophaga flavus]
MKEVSTSQKPRKKSKSSHVPGQYLGYSLQTTRCLFHLLKVPKLSYSVSIEVFEDVGVEDSLGNRIAEQNKSALEGNPVSDKSKDLWKTFFNWIEAVESDELNPDKTLFIIHVAQLKKTNLAKKFSEASTIEMARIALDEAKTSLWGDAPEYNLKPLIAESISEYITKFFEADRDTVSKIISKFNLTFGKESIHDEVKETLQTRTRTDLIDLVYIHALGWVKKFTDELIEKSKPAIVPAKDFFNDLNAYIRLIDNKSILYSFAKNPDKIDIDSELKNLRTFIRQLDLIDFDNDYKIKAVVDFLKASSDRTEWSRRGLVHTNSFNDLEDRLKRKWENEKSFIEIMNNNLDSVKQGRLIYRACSQYEAKLEGFECPPHFIPGSYHLLAESPSDEPVIGWHPDYKTKLKETNKPDGDTK